MRPAGECSPRSPSGSLVTGVQRFATVPTPSSDVNHDTKQLDLLSIEMAEKILNEDDHGISDDSDDSYRQPSPSIVAITTTATASTFTGSKFCDISHQQAANGQTTVDSWEELVDRPPGDLLDFVPSGQVDSSLSSSSVVFETADIDNRPEMKADEDDLGHILEAYNISSETKTEALYLLLKQQNCRSFTVEWVDNTHALVRFQSISAVEGHLGMRPTARSRELRRQEKLVLDQAREKRKAAALVREELWEGKI
ncbi:unnamed protein product [Soboliphyme baturini]|uniref:R3H domain-containing protein n=1 Tax=Soboliphyme baturini TaxID=241478 RepID=A0A183J5G0_9BILA|nr:unnamed protein product [Soboliphyme baturini]